MFLMIYTDGDSGVFNLTGERCKTSIFDSTYIFELSTEEDKLKFIKAWKDRELGISDKMFDVLNYKIKDLEYFLLNKIETKIENGNYYFKLFKNININKI